MDLLTKTKYENFWPKLIGKLIGYALLGLIFQHVLWMLLGKDVPYWLDFLAGIAFMKYLSRVWVLCLVFYYCDFTIPLWHSIRDYFQ